MTNEKATKHPAMHGQHHLLITISQQAFYLPKRSLSLILS